MSSNVRDKLNENDSLRVFTFSDFLKQMIWGPYIESLESLVKKSRIPELYVDLACYTQEIREGDILISKTLEKNVGLLKRIRNGLKFNNDTNLELKRRLSEIEAISEIKDSIRGVLSDQLIDDMFSREIEIKDISDRLKREFDDGGSLGVLNRYPSLDGYLDDWLQERGKMHISLLGPFGSGKTWFCRHYAYRQLLRYLKDPINERFPLLITLRNFSKSMNSQQLINTHY